MLVLLEIKMANHKALTETLKFDVQIQSSATGCRRGIIVMWMDENLKLDNVLVTPQGVHVMVKVTSNPNS